ncbi:MAG TPA: VWA domain-containing protein [Blastocatellia bacterium]|nr:VWA domain-containing protein [Blastocatellia bacterium]
MKLKRISLAAVLICAVALAFLPSIVVQAQQSKPQEKRGQQKTDKNKKPSEAEDNQDDQAIKLGAQLVTVPFNVTDKKNRYINDLTKNDIEVLEDGKPQDVFSFERQTDLPITIAMLIDISGSQEYTLPEEKAAGQRFFKRVLRPKKDLGAVVTFEHESVLVQDLTSDVGKLQRALDDVRISVPTALAGQVGTTPPINNSGVGSTSMYDSIYSVASDLLRREAGRRVIILVTDGEDTSSSVKMRDAIERTWRSEIIVYSIGIGGPMGVDSGTLKKIAAETGGRAFFPRNEADLDTAYAQIDEDLRSQYITAYTPANSARDGSFRTIQVRVKNQKDLNVRYRRGYFAPKAS